MTSLYTTIFPGTASGIISGPLRFAIMTGGGKKNKTKKKKTKKNKQKKTKKQRKRSKVGKKHTCFKDINSKSCIKAQIRDNPWMLEPGGEKLVGNKFLLKEIRRIKKTKKQKRNKKK